MHLYLRVSEGRCPGEGAGAIPSFGEIRILLKVFKGPWLEGGVGAIPSFGETRFSEGSVPGEGCLGPTSADFSTDCLVQY